MLIDEVDSKLEIRWLRSSQLAVDRLHGDSEAIVRALLICCRSGPIIHLSTFFDGHQSYSGARQGTLSHPFLVFMDLPNLNLHPGIGVQVATHHRFGEPVNFFPVSGLKEFLLLVSIGRCKYHLSELSVGLLL
jgi:hypothetical protein